MRTACSVAVVATLAALALPSCKPSPGAAERAATTTTTTTTTATPTTTTTTATPIVRAGGAPTFIEDDAAKAFEAAQASGRLVFVDAWAPWCHTCLSMQRDVLDRPELGAFGDRLVFLAVDTDRPENAAFLERFRVKVWPTFFVVDPTNDAPLAVHPGSMGLQETRRFVDDALKTRDPQAQQDPLVRALLAGHQALAKNDPTTATKHYAIAAAAAGPRRSEAIIGGLRAFSLTDDHDGCVAFGQKYADLVEGGGAAGDALSYMQSCADAFTDARQQRFVREVLVKRLTALADKPAAEASVDDQADVLANLADVSDSLAEGSGKVFHERRLKLLEDDAQKQTTPTAQQVHDYARMNSLLALGRGDEAVALFQKRTQERPDDYEPWARLGSTLHKLKRDDEAKAVVEKAVALSYGTRRLRYLQLLADVEEGRKDVDAAHAARRRLIEENEKLPAVLQDAKLVAAAQSKLPQKLPQKL